jgi:hypothetical protein
MKKFLFTVVLVAASAAFAQDSGASQTGTKTKTIADQAEYNAYISATGIQDACQRAAALESFVQSYPNTVVKEGALEASMSSYQQCGNAGKVGEVAKKVLDANPNNVLALVVTAYTLDSTAKDAQGLAQASDYARKGLVALPGRQKPDGLADAEFQKQQQQFTALLNGIVGHAALANKDFAGAQKPLRDAVKIDPTNINNVFYLAQADLYAKPPTDEAQLEGLWYIARVIDASPNFKQAVDAGKYYYKKFHGSEEGWDQLLAQAKNEPLPPADLATKVTKYTPPTPEQQIQDWLAKTKPEEMDWGQWIFILTNGTQEQKDTVWNAIKDKPLKFLGKVQASDKDSVTMSVTEDGIQANVPEVKITMINPMKVPPPAGSENFQVQAVPKTFTLQPFMANLEEGQPIGPSIQLTGGGKATPKAKAKATTKAKAKTKRK